MRVRRLATNVLLACASVVVTATVIELGVRRLGPDVGRFLRPTRANCLRRSPSLSYEFVPLCHGELSGTTFRTNSLATRGDEPHPDRPRRVVALGDSCTWGWAVAQDETYPVKLQRLFDAENAAPAVDVINAGVPGWTSYQGVEYLREQAAGLHPSVVIIGFGFNDQFESGDIAQQIAQERRYRHLVYLDDFLLDRSMTYRWARWRAAESDEAAKEARVSPEAYRANLTAMVQITRNENATPVLLSFWTPRGVHGDYRQAILDVAAALDVPLIEYDGKRMDLVHPTREGYQGLAQRAFEQLRRSGFP